MNMVVILTLFHTLCKTVLVAVLSVEDGGVFRCCLGQKQRFCFRPHANEARLIQKLNAMMVE